MDSVKKKIFDRMITTPAWKAKSVNSFNRSDKTIAKYFNCARFVL